jgi:hypothetical protein
MERMQLAGAGTAFGSPAAPGQGTQAMPLLKELVRAFSQQQLWAQADVI